jgi:hypothetical protein
LPLGHNSNKKLGQKLTPSAGLLATTFIGASLPRERAMQELPCLHVRYGCLPGRCGLPAIESYEQLRLESGLSGHVAQRACLPGGRNRPGVAAQPAGLAQRQSAQPSERGSLAWSASWRAQPRNNSWPAAFFLFFFFLFSFFFV